MNKADKIKPIERGILILCYGHPYYGRYCFNLAASIKAVENIPIAVLRGGRGLSHLSEKQLSIFDYIIDLPEGIDNGFTPKLHLGELTPFKETIFLDADMLWLPKKSPTELFDNLQGVEYTGITEGWYDIATEDKSNASQKYYFWADPDEIKKTYKLETGKIFQWRSEFIYFKKTARIIKFFKRAQAIHANPKVTVQKHFAMHVPDELGINISAAIHGIEPHQAKWSPAYWHKLHRDHIPAPGELHGNWYLISFGSNFVNGSVKKVYDNLAKAALNKLGMQHVFSMHSKKEFLPERVKI